MHLAWRHAVLMVTSGCGIWNRKWLLTFFPYYFHFINVTDNYGHRNGLFLCDDFSLQIIYILLWLMLKCGKTFSPSQGGSLNFRTKARSQSGVIITDNNMMHVFAEISSYLFSMMHVFVVNFLS